MATSLALVSPVLVGAGMGVLPLMAAVSTTQAVVMQLDRRPGICGQGGVQRCDGPGVGSAIAVKAWRGPGDGPR